MSFNSRSSPNFSVLPPLLSNSFLYPHFYECSESPFGSTVFTTFTCTSFFLLLPLSVLVLSVGVQRWWKQRRATTATPVSHSDFLTYNIIAMEPIGLFACGCYCGGIFLDRPRLMRAGVFIVFIVYLGRLLFQCLTCVEHYLAVIHPITFLRLKTERGIRIRNVIAGSVWLLCLGTLSFVVSYCPETPTIPFFTVFAFGLLVMSFCSLSVICALIRPGPGAVGGDRKRVDQSKQRALLTILAINSVIFLKYVGLLVCTALYASSLLEYHDGCLVLMFSFWFCLPSSLALPLLFLYRAGKLPCLSDRTESGGKT